MHVRASCQGGRADRDRVVEAETSEDRSPSGLPRAPPPSPSSVTLTPSLHRKAMEVEGGKEGGERLRLTFSAMM